MNLFDTLIPQTKLEVVQKYRRQGLALLIYQSIVALIFLVTAFRFFPLYQAPIAFGYLLFTSFVSVIGNALSYHFALQNMIDDEAERKTRHTILLAYRLKDEPPIDELTFWGKVNQAVQDERPSDSIKLSFWASLGRIVGSLFLQIAFAAGWIGLALALVG